MLKMLLETFVQDGTIKSLKFNPSVEVDKMKEAAVNIIEITDSENLNESTVLDEFKNSAKIFCKSYVQYVINSLQQEMNDFDNKEITLDTILTILCKR
jgi:hypothetical protein